MLDKRKIPFVTIAICSALVILYMANMTDPALFKTLTGTTGNWNQGNYLNLITYSLGHTGLWHLFLNVSMILYVGSKIELRYNRLLYLFLYIVSAAVAGVFFFWVYSSHGQTMSMLGASGAKCGLFGFYAMMFVYTIWTADDSETIVAEFKGSRVVFALIAFEILLSFMPNIAWAAHIGGAAAGIAIGLCVIGWHRWNTPKELR